MESAGHLRHKPGQPVGGGDHSHGHAGVGAAVTARAGGHSISSLALQWRKSPKGEVKSTRRSTGSLLLMIQLAD
jgi:hypothetical protein